MTANIDTQIGWLQVVLIAIPGVIGIAGVIVGSWLTARHQRIERRNARRREQLMEFYAPMRGMRAEIKAKSELRIKIHAAGGELWEEKLQGVDDPEMKKKIDERDWEKYKNTLDYSNKQLENIIIPLYRRMLEHFASRMGFAEESTLQHYPAFVEFVEIWNRFLEKTLPGELANKLDHSEKKLYPLYEDIEENFKRLSAELRG